MPVFQLVNDVIFPSPDLAEEDGLLAIGGDLSPARLQQAYKLGIFPWYSPGDPILWWSPAPRCILLPDEFHISRRLARTIRSGKFQTTFDKAFVQVITACAETNRPKSSGTWITPEMIAAYTQLHELGYAHSVECWSKEELAGGIYGVALGRVFFGESMFSRYSEGSKIAFASLVGRLKKWNFDFIDCQIKNDHLIQLGAREISRDEFQRRLRENVERPGRLGKWNM